MLRSACFVCFLAFVFTSCSFFGSYTHTPFSPVHPTQEIIKFSSPRATFFDYEKKQINWISRTLTDYEQTRYEELLISFPSMGDNGQKDNRVYLRYLKNKLAGKKRLIVVLRIPGGPSTEGFPSSIMAAHLTNWGHLSYPWFTQSQDMDRMNVIIIENVKGIVDWQKFKQVRTETALLEMAERTVNVIRTHVIDIRRLLDLVETWEEIDEKRIGIVGFSTSATEAIIAMSIDKRLSAGVFVGGVARFHELIAYGTKEITYSVQKVVEKTLGLTKQQLADKLEAAFAPIDPIKYAHMINSERVLMFDSRYDEYLSEEMREALAKSLGRPERVTYNLGHTRTIAIGSSVLGGGKIGRMAKRFFDEKL